MQQKSFGPDKNMTDKGTSQDSNPRLNPKSTGGSKNKGNPHSKMMGGRKSAVRHSPRRKR